MSETCAICVDALLALTLAVAWLADGKSLIVFDLQTQTEEIEWNKEAQPFDIRHYLPYYRLFERGVSRFHKFGHFRKFRLAI